MKVKLFASFREGAGTSRVEIEAGTVRELLHKLTEKYEDLSDPLLVEKDGKEEVGSGVTVMLNGRNIRFLQGLGTELKEDDTIAIFPPIGGG